MQVERRHGPRSTWSWLLASDLDGTLIPVEPVEGYEHELTRFRLALRDNPGGMLAYITGRHAAIALDGILDAGLPRPEMLVCDVGTKVLERAGPGEWSESARYAERMTEALGEKSVEEHAEPLDGVAWLTLQEDEKQSSFKRSYYFPADRQAVLVHDELRQLLDAAGSSCSLVASHDPADGRGLVDLLPRGVDKATALDFVRERAGVPLDRVVYAGDSGNDTAALTSGCRGILVANAARETRDQIASRAARLGLLDRIHFAAAPLAAGVIEGCERFGIFGPGSA